MDVLNIIHETEDGFKNIARKLFNEFVIQTHNSKYRIIEIEFYWNSTSHVDKSTYERKYVDPKTGEWFFHYSGVDIALRNEKGYGGILLRSVLDLNGEDEKKSIYKGPMICAMRLFSGTNAFDDLIRTKIVQHVFKSEDIFQSERIGLGNNAKENGADKHNYRFFIPPILK